MSSTKLVNGNRQHAFMIELMWYLFGTVSGCLLIPITISIYGVPIVTVAVQVICYALGWLFAKYERGH